MERNRHISGIFLGVCIFFAACSQESMDSTVGQATLSITCGIPESRTAVPDENIVNDINLILFENGKAESMVWKDCLQADGRTDIDISYVKGRRYSLFVMANMGEKISVRDTSDLKKLTMELPGNQGFSNGLPMSTFFEDISFDGKKKVDVSLERLTAKISIRIDRSRLSKNVEMSVKEVRIGNYPKYANIIGPSRISSTYDRFETGFHMTGSQCMPLNDTGMGGISEDVSVYMLENMQGTFPYRINEDEEKIFDKDDPLSELCSYLELTIDYNSPDLISYDSPLIYRFYLGDGLRSLDVERNCHYHITIIPENDGLAGGGWRVDKSGIGPSTPLFKMHPGNYIEGNVGDTLHVRCECYPMSAPFDPGYEELDYDKSRGIYDYMIDENGHGVRLFLKKAGTGIVFMSAGAPINQSGMVIVYVNP